MRAPLERPGSAGIGLKRLRAEGVDYSSSGHCTGRDIVGSHSPAGGAPAAPCVRRGSRGYPSILGGSRLGGRPIAHACR
eukprot:2536718-Prorocentrum_lima.AAC.1